MKTRYLIGLSLLAAAVLILTTDLRAEEKVTLKGSVSVTENDDWEVTGVFLTVTEGKAAGKYTVALDAKGRELGRKADGQEAEVTGTLATKDGKKELKVASYKVVVVEEEGGGEDEE